MFILTIISKDYSERTIIETCEQFYNRMFKFIHDTYVPN